MNLEIDIFGLKMVVKSGLEFQNRKKSRPLFTIIFKPKMVVSWLKILVTYSSNSRWCIYIIFFPICKTLFGSNIRYMFVFSAQIANPKSDIQLFWSIDCRNEVTFEKNCCVAITVREVTALQRTLWLAFPSFVQNLCILFYSK